MSHWNRFLDRIIALINSPGFDELAPAEQDRLYDEIAKLMRAERLLAKSLPPYRFFKKSRPGFTTQN